jgi:hypothetical protein
MQALAGIPPCASESLGVLFKSAGIHSHPSWNGSNRELIPSLLFISIPHSV